MIEFKPFSLYLTYDEDDLNRICKTVKEWDDKADTKHFYKYMRMGVLNHRIFPFVSYDDDRNIIACTVLSVAESPMYTDKVLYIQWVWIDPHYQTYWKKGIGLLYELAKNVGAKKIVGNVRRLPRLFERKFGFKQVDAIIEKDIE